MTEKKVKVVVPRSRKDENKEEIERYISESTAMCRKTSNYP